MTTDAALTHHRPALRRPRASLRKGLSVSLPTVAAMTNDRAANRDERPQTPETSTGQTLGGRADPDSSASKDPADWVTGDEPMTGPQRSYLDTLAREAGEEISADLTKAQASEHIERLQAATGRGSSDAGS